MESKNQVTADMPEAQKMKKPSSDDSKPHTSDSRTKIDSATASSNSSQLNSFFDALFEPARTANALGNGAISAGAIKSNPGVLALGLITGMINSYAAGEARETTPPPPAHPALWWSDRIISLMYGIGCGATTAASAYQIFITLSLMLSGPWGLIGFGALIGLMTVIASYKRLGLARAIILACAITAIYVAIGYLVVSLGGAGLLAPILLVSTYFLSACLGFCTTILNYGITQNSIISLMTRESSQKLVKQNRAEQINYAILVSVATISCIASGCAIGGLTYISIMALPAAFSFTMPIAAIMTIAVFIAAITTFAMIPLLIKQCLPIAQEWAKVSIREIPGIIGKHLKLLFIFDKTRYQPSWSNYFKFYLKTTLLLLIVPIAITGSVLTMLQASNALSDVIKIMIQSLKLAARSDEEATAKNLAYATLGGALISDLIFSISTALSWAGRLGSHIAEDEKKTKKGCTYRPRAATPDHGDPAPPPIRAADSTQHQAQAATPMNTTSGANPVRTASDPKPPPKEPGDPREVVASNHAAALALTAAARSEAGSPVPAPTLAGGGGGMTLFGAYARGRATTLQQGVIDDAISEAEGATPRTTLALEGE